ncbi:zinc ribbon domain-containing protein [Acinetobacter indicus]|nr:zinc ribbon domain-containing protein [Acinetobacter indicus]
MSHTAREWKCLVCQTIQNRDVNASINILRYADKDLITA